MSVHFSSDLKEFMKEKKEAKELDLKSKRSLEKSIRAMKKSSTKKRSKKRK
jgi:hypothetical protein